MEHKEVKVKLPREISLAIFKMIDHPNLQDYWKVQTATKMDNVDVIKEYFKNKAKYA